MATLDDLREALVTHMLQIEDVCRGFGLPMDEFTLIVRERNNDEMSVVITSEGEGQYDRLIEVLRKRLA